MTGRFQIGKLRIPVQLLHVTLVDSEEYGQRIEHETPFDTDFADIASAGGGQYETADQMRASSARSVVMRYREDLGPNDRIRNLETGEVINVIAPPRDPDGRRRWLEIDGMVQA